MKLSIVVPAFNEEKLIAETLKRIRHATGVLNDRGWVVELIVCDNNSTDRTQELAQAAGATVVFEPINQIARARNRGASVATGDWLLFVDADSHPCPGLFQEMAEAIESGHPVAGGSTIRLDANYFIAGLVTRVWNRTSRITKWVAGSYIFCETGAFRELGGFSDKLFASEEIEFSKRLKQLARKRRKKVTILHRNPLTTSARKIHLYTPKEYFIFITKTVFGFGAALKSREDCHVWYDGRR